VPAARRWRNDTEDFRFPLAVPREPRRFYFQFGAPVPTDDLDAADRAACAAVYAAAEQAVKASVAHLLDRRRDDAYDRAVPRLARELATGQTAPTFPV
jgi:hypothetical protein